jgi:hypothetical protein
MHSHILRMCSSARRLTAHILAMPVSQLHILYPCEEGPMGGAPYIGPKRGGGPIFQVSVSQLDTNEHPGKLPKQPS